MLAAGTEKKKEKNQQTEQSRQTVQKYITHPLLCSCHCGCHCHRYRLLCASGGIRRFVWQQAKVCQYLCIAPHARRFHSALWRVQPKNQKNCALTSGNVQHKHTYTCVQWLLCMDVIVVAYCGCGIEISNVIC